MSVRPARQLQKKLKEASTLSQQKTEVSEKSETKSSASATVEEEPTTIAKLQEQLLHEKQKTTEYRNQCHLLKQDLKLAHRVLGKEVGEGVSVSVLLSGVSGWRGRAQQIITLQAKVTELKKQLEQLQGASKVGRREATNPDQTSSRIEARQKATLEKIEKERIKNLEGARLELESVRAEYSSVQQQCSALKARNKLLSADIKSLKSQLATLEAKGSGCSDIKRASTCNDRNGSTRRDKEKDRLGEENRQLQARLAKCLQEIQSLKQASRHSKSEEAHSVRQTIESKTRRIDSAESNSPSISLPPIVHPKPSSNRTHPSIRRSFGQSPVRKSVSAGQSTSHSLAQVSQVETDRLMELTTTLQRRLDTTRDSMMRMETEQQTQRQVIAKLERQLGRRQQKHDSRDGSRKPVHDFEDELALQVNENAVLRETLELTRHEKMEDIRVFHAMLQEAKQLVIGNVGRIQK